MVFVIIAAVIAAVLLIYTVLIVPGRLPKGAGGVLWRSVYAHRGLHTKDKRVPENSMAAFSAAVDAGYGIELDINITTDGQVVVFHDDTLLRMCGSDKPVSACSFDELQQYRLLDTEARIPLFRDVLALVDGRVPLVVELKNTAERAALCEKAAALLDGYGGPYCIESFHPGIVMWFRKNRPGVVRGYLSAGLKNYKSIPLYQGILLSSLMTNALSRPHFVAFHHPDAKGRFRIKLYRLLGGKLVGWTVRDTDDADACRAFFDAIIFEHFKPQAQ